MAVEDDQIVTVVRAMQAEDEAVRGAWLARPVQVVRLSGRQRGELRDGNEGACAPAPDAELDRAIGQLQRDEPPGESTTAEGVDRGRETDASCRILEGVMPRRRPV